MIDQILGKEVKVFNATFNNISVILWQSVHLAMSGIQTHNFRYNWNII